MSNEKRLCIECAYKVNDLFGYGACQGAIDSGQSLMDLNEKERKGQLTKEQLEKLERLSSFLSSKEAKNCLTSTKLVELVSEITDVTSYRPRRTKNRCLR